MPCECTFDQDITLAPGATWLNGRATLFNARSDHTDYGVHGQELPATYTIGDLHNLVAYTGNAPWTNAPVSNVSTPAGPPWVPGVITVVSRLLSARAQPCLRQLVVTLGLITRCALLLAD